MRAGVGTVGAMLFPGWKRAQLLGRVENRQLLDVSYCGHTRSDIYRSDQPAECSYGVESKHSDGIPGAECSCGYWAVSTPEAANQATYEGGMFYTPGTTVVLEVAAYGTVVEATEGWRASHMQIFSVSLPRLCDCGTPAVGVAVVRPHDYVAGWSYLDVVCAQCRPRAFHIDDVERCVGVPVLWGAGTKRTPTDPAALIFPGRYYREAVAEMNRLNEDPDSTHEERMAALRRLKELSADSIAAQRWQIDRHSPKLDWL